MTAERIIYSLQSGNVTLEDEACRFIYQQYYGLVESLVLKNGLPKTNSKDIFQDAIVVLWKMVNKKDFQLTSTVKTLLYSIAFNQVRNRLRNQGRTTNLVATHETIQLEESHFESIIRGEKTTLILQLLQALGEDCQKVLDLFYFQQLSMKKIQAIFRDKSDAVTKNRKARCLQRIRDRIGTNQQLMIALKY